MRNGVASHRASEYEKYRRKDRGFDHRERYLEHDLPLGSIKDRSRLFEVRVHVLENAAYQDVGEGRVVKSQNHGTREESLAPPVRQTDAEQRGEQTVRGSRNLIRVEHVLPYNSQCPLGHDIRENEYRA